MADSPYDDRLIARLHLIWGEGFLSPGGPAEVREIVSGLDLSGLETLDIGSGTGGPASVLAGTFGAHVTGIDVAPRAVAFAEALARRPDLGGRMTVRLVEPGPLPFPDGRFDLVFSKDSLIHIPDKPALYREILRVLKPGGRFTASDWLSGPGADQDADFQAYLDLSGYDFTLKTAAEIAQTMGEAGFQAVETRDRNAWYADKVKAEVADLEGPVKAQVIEAAGQATYDRWLKARRHLVTAVANGSLRPTHLRGVKPG